MKSRQIGMLIVAVLLLLVTAAAKDKLKPWTQWTADDAKKILDDSPWGQGYMTSLAVPSAAAPLEGHFAQLGAVLFQIRLISAKPIRQAILRTLELNPSKAAPQQIDEARSLLDRRFDDTIVVAVSPDTAHFSGLAGAASPAFSFLFHAFNSTTTATLKNHTYLELDNGKQIFLQEYQPPGPDGLGAKFTFSRKVNGMDFISPDARSVRFFTRFPDQAFPPPGTNISRGNPDNLSALATGRSFIENRNFGLVMNGGKMRPPGGKLWSILTWCLRARESA